MGFHKIDELNRESTVLAKRKRRTRSPEIRFEKHYGEPLTEQEQDELADLIAQMIYEGRMKGLETKTENTSRNGQKENG